MSKIRGTVLLLLVGAFVAAGVELFLTAGDTNFAQRMEAFDTILPVVVMGLGWLFTRKRDA